MKFKNSQQNPPMQSHEIPLYPFQFVSMDVCFARFGGKKCKFLVTVDHYSDYFELDILPDMTAESVIKVCKQNFSRHGISFRICSDNDTNFENKLMKRLSSNWGFDFTTQTINRLMAKRRPQLQSQRSLYRNLKITVKIWFMLLHWRNTPNKMASSPSQRSSSPNQNRHSSNNSNIVT